MRDVDRYVDKLYEPTLTQLQIPFIKTEWHRYVVDLNRLPSDTDQNSVEGSSNPPGTFARGFHWSITTLGEKLLPRAMPMALHRKLVRDYYEPFHEKMRRQYDDFHRQGADNVYHIDAHSMPSMGTKEHRDPGQRRKDIVVSDCNGKSCSAWFKDLVIESYTRAGFEVAYNWPYVGGRVTETYGHPERGHHSIQVEMSRALYMNEDDKSYTPNLAQGVQECIKSALNRIFAEIPDL